MSIANDMSLELRVEYEGADLGDARRTKRLLEMVDAIAKSPDASLPNIFTGSAALEGSYRLLRNKHVTHEAILEPHRQQTAARGRACEMVIAAHDTTEFKFGKNPRKDLGQVGKGKSHGFYGHFTLVIAGDSHLPLGVCALSTHRRDGKQAKNGGKSGHSKRHNDPENEGLRWFRGVEESAKTLSGYGAVVHVMDREADDYALLSNMRQDGHRFVIRSCYDRRTSVGSLKLSEVLSKTPQLEGSRTITISKRGESSMPGQRKRHPPRVKRQAELVVRATRVVVQRPDSAPRDCLSVTCLHAEIKRVEPGLYFMRDLGSRNGLKGARARSLRHVGEARSRRTGHSEARNPHQAR